MMKLYDFSCRKVGGGGPGKATIDVSEIAGVVPFTYWVPGDDQRHEGSTVFLRGGGEIQLLEAPEKISDILRLEWGDPKPAQ